MLTFELQMCKNLTLDEFDPKPEQINVVSTGNMFALPNTLIHSYIQLGMKVTVLLDATLKIKTPCQVS